MPGHQRVGGKSKHSCRKCGVVIDEGSKCERCLQKKSQIIQKEWSDEEPIECKIKHMDIFEILEMSICELDIPVKEVNCLEKEKIFSVENLISNRDDDLLRIKNLGRKSLGIIKKAILPIEREFEKRGATTLQT